MTSKRTISAIRGFMGNWIGTIDGDRRPCRHIHRTRNGAETCARQIAQWEERTGEFHDELDMAEHD